MSGDCGEYFAVLLICIWACLCCEVRVRVCMSKCMKRDIAVSRHSGITCIVVLISIVVL